MSDFVCGVTCQEACSKKRPPPPPILVKTADLCLETSSDFIYNFGFVVEEIFFNQEKLINATGSGNLMLSFKFIMIKKTNKKNRHTQKKTP